MIEKLLDTVDWQKKKASQQFIIFGKPVINAFPYPSLRAQSIKLRASTFWWENGKFLSLTLAPSKGGGPFHNCRRNLNKTVEG